MRRTRSRQQDQGRGQVPRARSSTASPSCRWRRRSATATSSTSYGAEGRGCAAAGAGRQERQRRRDRGVRDQARSEPQEGARRGQGPVGRGLRHREEERHLEQVEPARRKRTSDASSPTSSRCCARSWSRERRRHERSNHDVARSRSHDPHVRGVAPLGRHGRLRRWRRQGQDHARRQRHDDDHGRLAVDDRARANPRCRPAVAPPAPAQAPGPRLAAPPVRAARRSPVT